jgi:hypothetical protein
MFCECFSRACPAGAPSGGSDGGPEAAAGSAAETAPAGRSAGPGDSDTDEKEERRRQEDIPRFQQMTSQIIEKEEGGLILFYELVRNNRRHRV